MEIVEIGDALGDDAEGEGLGTLLFTEVGSVTEAIAEEAQIHFVKGFDAIADGAGEGIAEHFGDVVVGGDRELIGGDTFEFAIDTKRVTSIGLSMEIRGPAFLAPIEQVGEGAGEGDTFHNSETKMECSVWACGWTIRCSPHEPGGAVVAAGAGGRLRRRGGETGRWGNGRCADSAV